MACQRVGILFGHWQSFEASGASLIGLGATILSVYYVPGPCINYSLSLCQGDALKSHLASYKTDSESSVLCL